MYCPKCGLGYGEGVTVCSNCDEALVAEPPTPQDTAEWRELEVVLETDDPTLIPVVRSLLEAEGIPCFTRGERIQEFLGLGRVPSGVNLITGPVPIEVPRERAEEARQLIAAQVGETQDTGSGTP